MSNASKRVVGIETRLFDIGASMHQRKGLFGNLKNGRVPLIGFQPFLEAKFAVSNYITGYYSRVSLHQNNGGLLPNEAEKK